MNLAEHSTASRGEGGKPALNTVTGCLKVMSTMKLKLECVTVPHASQPVCSTAALNIIPVVHAQVLCIVEVDRRVVWQYLHT
jgi:hypothetical protein